MTEHFALNRAERSNVALFSMVVLGGSSRNGGPLRHLEELAGSSQMLLSLISLACDGTLRDIEDAGPLRPLEELGHSSRNEGPLRLLKEESLHLLLWAAPLGLTVTTLLLVGVTSWLSTPLVLLSPVLVVLLASRSVLSTTRAEV